MCPANLVVAPDEPACTDSDQDQQQKQRHKNPRSFGFVHDASGAEGGAGLRKEQVATSLQFLKQLCPDA